MTFTLTTNFHSTQHDSISMTKAPNMFMYLGEHNCLNLFLIVNLTKVLTLVPEKYAELKVFHKHQGVYRRIIIGRSNHLTFPFGKHPNPSTSSLINFLHPPFHQSRSIEFYFVWEKKNLLGYQWGHMESQILKLEHQNYSTITLLRKMFAQINL